MSKPTIGILYDFDKTLTPDDMQSQGFIQKLGYEVSSFWDKSNGLSENNDMDQNLAYMYTMIQESTGKVLFTKDTLREYGAKIDLFPGVENWFERIRKYADEKGVILEHYIISSGLKEMIEGTKVANSFERIYASSFYYDRNVAVWPAQVVNYTNKTQFLFRIEKGTLDVNDPGINDYFDPENIRVPFRNMIYIGDSDTDIPCMKLVNSNGGYSIGVYNPTTKKKEKVYKMMHDNRIRYFAPADYTEDSDLDKLVKSIIDRTLYNEFLESIHYDNKNEYEHDEINFSEEQKKKKSLILSLEESRNFKTTHTLITELDMIDNWNQSEANWLCEIANNNSQVSSIILDRDIARFYRKIIEISDLSDENVKKIKEMLNGK